MSSIIICLAINLGILLSLIIVIIALVSIFAILSNITEGPADEVIKRINRSKHELTGKQVKKVFWWILLNSRKQTDKAIDLID